MTELEKRKAAAPVPSEWDYAPAPEARDLVWLRERYGLFVGGESLEPKSGEWYVTIDPSSEEPLAEIAQAGKEDVDLAVSAARDAFEDGWSDAAPSERAKYLFRIARILQERSREFAVLESLNGGKPIRESRDVDLPLAAAHFFYYAGWADKLEYAFPNRRPRPVGVAGQIIPWNFPLLMLAWKVAPALAAGNTVVLKPAETTPLSALLFCDVVEQAELPPGVVNIVTGDGRTGAEIVKHEGVDKIAFTGSTEVGKAIQRELAGTEQAADARARRQGGEHRLRRRGARPGGRGDRQRHLLQPGPRLLRGLAAAGPGVDLRAASSTSSSGAWRRSASATRSTRTPTSARSTRSSSSTRSRSSSRPARRKAPRSTSRRAGSRRRATGSCRRSSRTSRRATASRRRRSSARCSRC